MRSGLLRMYDMYSAHQKAMDMILTLSRYNDEENTNTNTTTKDSKKRKRTKQNSTSVEMLTSTYLLLHI